MYENYLEEDGIDEYVFDAIAQLTPKQRAAVIAEASAALNQTEEEE